MTEHVRSIRTIDEDGIAIIFTWENRLILYDLRTGEMIRAWCCPDPDCTMLAVITGRIFLACPEQDKILIYDKTGGRDNDLSLRGIELPDFLTDYDGETLIITGDGRIGRFPICEVSEPLWIQDMEGVYSVCVDDTGLIYVPMDLVKVVHVLSSSGRVLRCSGIAQW